MYTHSAHGTRLEQEVKTSFVFSVVDREVKAQSPWGDIAQTELDEALRVTANTNVAKNVIVFLGDGMSISMVTASRILQGRLKAELGEGNYLAFEKFPNSGLIKVYY